MKRLFTIGLLVTACTAGYAQSFSDLKMKNGQNPMDKTIFKLFARYTSLSSKLNGTYGSPTINLALKTDHFGKWERRTRYENPTLGDLVRGIPQAVRDIRGIRDGDQTTLKENKWDNHAHGGGIVGWLQYYVNAVANDKLLISPGISLGDYIYTSKYPSGPNAGKIDDPAGYFVNLGPGLMATYLVDEKIWIDAYVNYDIHLLKVSGPSANYTATPGYKHPDFMSIGLDVNSSSRLFGGIRLNRLIDKGAFNDRSSRLDISVGVGL